MHRFLKHRLLVYLVLFSSTAWPYSILTHEAIIDASWESAILPLLKKKFPQADEKDLKKAHAYAYGGAIMPDMGYFPFGSKRFTDMVHYVRTGDFVQTLIDSARDVKELAFAYGALAHYFGDKIGHSHAVNRCIHMVYPDATQDSPSRDTITYEQDKLSHRRLEFGYDVIQVARGNYAHEAFHNFIGFKISDDLLRRAFKATYGMELSEIFPSFFTAVPSLRFSVKRMFPRITKAAWVTKRKEIEKNKPGITGKQFIYHMPFRTYKKEYREEKPGIRAHFVALVVLLVPKVGPARALKFKTPTEEAEKRFLESFEMTVTELGKALKSQNLRLENINYDTGKKVKKGEYKLTDETYDELLDDSDEVSLAQKKDIVQYYESSQPSCKNKKRQKRLCKKLDRLKKEFN